MIRVLGLDLSTASSGLAMPDGTCHTLRPRTKNDPGRRLHEILMLVEPYLRLAKAQLAVIEIPVVGRNGTTTRRIIEVVGVIRARLHEHDVRDAEVIATSLKLFATGSGNADKQKVTGYVRNYGGKVANDDEADAWILRAMGLYAHGELVVPREPFRDEAVRKVRWPRLTLTEVTQ